MPSDQHTMLREEMEAWILNKLDDYRADIVITGRCPVNDSTVAYRTVRYMYIGIGTSYYPSHIVEVHFWCHYLAV